LIDPTKKKKKRRRRCRQRDMAIPHQRLVKKTLCKFIKYLLEKQYFQLIIISILCWLQLQFLRYSAGGSSIRSPEIQEYFWCYRLLCSTGKYCILSISSSIIVILLMVLINFRQVMLFWQPELHISFAL
jgi:hypothetical protein